MGTCESRLSTMQALKSKFAAPLPFVYCWFETSYRAAQAVARYVAQAGLTLTPHLPVSTLSSFSTVSLRSKGIFVVI